MRVTVGVIRAGKVLTYIHNHMGLYSLRQYLSLESGPLERECGKAMSPPKAHMPRTYITLVATESMTETMTESITESMTVSTLLSGQQTLHCAVALRMHRNKGRG